MTNAETIGIIMFILFIFFLLAGVIFLKYDADRNKRDEESRRRWEREREDEEERRKREEEERRRMQELKIEILDKINEVTKR